jgi:hypothetical protein
LDPLSAVLPPPLPESLVDTLPLFDHEPTVEPE